MLDIEEQLHRYARAAGDSVPAAQASARAGNRWARVLLVAALLVAFVAGGILVAVSGGGEDDVTVVAGPGRAGGWTTMPAGPLTGRTGEVAVSTEGEMIIWGGRADQRFDDGAAYSFDTGMWRPLAPSPLSPRSDAIGVWTGTEVLIWGGTERDGEGLGNGAAYNPETNSWRELPDLEATQSRGDDTTGVWTGSDLVLVGVDPTPEANLTTNSFALDLATAEWRPLAPLEGPEIHIRNVVWSGTEVLATTATVDGSLLVDALDLDTVSWQRRAEAQVPSLEVTATAVWTGSRLALVGLQTDGVLIDVGTGETASLPAAGTRNHRRFPTVALDRGLIVVGERWFNPTAGAWSDTGPIPGPERFGPSAVTRGGALYVWGGRGCLPDGTCDSPSADSGPGLVWTMPSVDEQAAPETPPESPGTTAGGRVIVIGPPDQMTPADLEALQDAQARFPLPAGAAFETPGQSARVGETTLMSGLAYAAACMWFEQLVPAVDTGDLERQDRAFAALQEIRDMNTGGLVESTVDDVVAAARRGDTSVATQQITTNC